LTIDGEPAPIYRANRIMRGAAVQAGKHRLVFVYDPFSFRLGLGISAAGFMIFARLAVKFTRRPTAPSLAEGASWDG
jgi:uncharacterized membrane protein YfhO